MSNVLKEWRLKGINGNVLELERGESSFSSTYLDDPERLDKFLIYCGDFFEKDMKANVLGEPKKVETNRTPVKTPKGGSTSDKKEDFPEPVQEVLKLFQGEVIDGGSRKEEE